MANSDVAWNRLMVNSANALYQEKLDQAQSELNYEEQLEERLRVVSRDLAMHLAVRAAILEALNTAVSSASKNDILWGHFAVAARSKGPDDVVGAFVACLHIEGVKRYEQGVSYDDLRKQAASYVPPGSPQMVVSCGS